MNFQDVLNAVAAGDSDNMTSKKLGVSRNLFSLWRTGRQTPKDDTLDKMAELSGLPIHQVYLAAYAEKLHNPKVAEVFRELATH